MDKTLAPHQDRVVAEHRDLTERLNKLLAFFQTPLFIGLPEAERSRLRSQARHMDGYAAVLEERIVAFSTSAPEPAVTDAMVQRFLQWPVPAHIRPDGTPGQPGRTGTNLLDALVARDMLAHVLSG